MACLAPISVLNPSVNFDYSGGKPLLQVPCGGCASCVDVKRKGWFLRAYFQMKSCLAAGGSCIFPTLTYNNEHLPRFRYDSDDGKFSYDIPCFSKKHIDRFLDSFRQACRRKYKTDDIKYLVCPEYGKRTKRPHYHVLLFLPAAVPTCYATRLCSRLWFDVEGNGFVMWSKKGKEVTSIAGCLYVSKYINKDLDFYGRSDVLSLKSNFPDIYNNDFSEFLPRHRQSKGFGLALYDKVLEDFDYYYNNGITLENGINYAIPRYIIDKFLYRYEFRGRVDETGKQLFDRLLTDFALEFKKRNYYKEIDNIVSRVNVDWLWLNRGNYSLDADKLAFLSSEFGVRFDSVDDVFAFAHSIIKTKDDVRNYAVYDYVFSNRVFDEKFLVGHFLNAHKVALRDKDYFLKCAFLLDTLWTSNRNYEWRFKLRYMDLNNDLFEYWDDVFHEFSTFKKLYGYMLTFRNSSNSDIRCDKERAVEYVRYIHGLTY